MCTRSVAIGAYHVALCNFLFDDRPAEAASSRCRHIEVLVSEVVKVHLPISESSTAILAWNVFDCLNTDSVLGGQSVFALRNLGDSGDLVFLVPRLVILLLTVFAEWLPSVALQIEGIKRQVLFAFATVFHTLKDYYSFKVKARSGAAPALFASKANVLADILSGHQCFSRQCRYCAYLARFRGVCITIYANRPNTRLLA